MRIRYVKILRHHVALFHSFNIFRSDCWNRPITGVPTRKTTVLERATDDFNRTFKYDKGEKRKGGKGNGLTLFSSF